jgi:hypothetical protein
MGEALLGWSRYSWASVEDWAVGMHLKNKEIAVNFCVAGLPCSSQYAEKAL